MQQSFQIDNSQHLIKEAIFWYLWLVLFMIVLWYFYINLDVNTNKLTQELLLNALQERGFVGLLLILFIIAPVSTIYKIRKIIKIDNKIFVNENSINYKESTFSFNDIVDIKIGCCPIKDGLFSYIFAYGIASFITIPLNVFDFVYFLLLKSTGHNNLKNINNRFVIFIKNNTPIVGTAYKQKELELLYNLKIFLQKKEFDVSEEHVVSI